MNEYKAAVIRRLLLVVIFWTVPFWLLGPRLEVLFAFFCGAVGAKWLIFALIESVKAWPERTELVASKFGLVSTD